MDRLKVVSAVVLGVGLLLGLITMSVVHERKVIAKAKGEGLRLGMEWQMLEIERMCATKRRLYINGATYRCYKVL